MIVWGGIGEGTPSLGVLNTGGRYNPAANNWTAVDTTGAPAPRSRHAAVWTGSEMIVWGGADGSNTLNDGGRYDPAGNNWTAMSSVRALPSRQAHTAVWTGGEMIIFGGVNGIGRYLNDTWSWTPGRKLALYQKP
jgi:N-acetylneuraminic acid mutarotase